MLNKSFLIILTVLALLGIFYMFNRPNKNSVANIMQLDSVKGLQITVPVKFSADENIIAAEIKITGPIVKIECVKDSMQVIVNEKDACVMGNLEGGAKTGVIANVTFIDNPNEKPIVSGVFRNVDAKEVKNVKLTIEY